MFNVERNQNKGRILNLLYKKKKLTKQIIAKELDISIPTVISNVNELIKDELVEEYGVADSTGGRKPVIVKFLENSRYSFGVNINPEKARVVLANLDLEIKYDEEFLIDGLKDFKAIMQEISECVKRALKVENIKSERILGIGFSLPGTVNEEKFLLELAPNIGIKNVNFKEFEDYFNMPMFVENEANAAALAELSVGVVKEDKNLVYISITSGVGTGIVVNGCLYKGKNKRAGEFGHMSIMPNGRRCKCGKTGCWEMYVSEKALLNGFNEISDKKVKNLFEFFKALSSDDERYKQYFDDYLNMLAIGIQNIELILDPHYIILGGEISKYEKYYMKELKEKIFIENSFYSKGDMKLLTSKLKKDSSVIGAALLPITSAFSIEEKII
ncbi:MULTISPECIES: ROK family protein [Clostridium]|uniref:ROK family protein n=1 Tax=Clostridium TaxID=1485 RepID=UPI00069DDFEB|nr:MULTISPECIES: ROK family protein [Clostridium]KOF56315.1 ArsR family transcriptional regulator [Clostridium sp. DMHC 10]MCD2347913.1 ROK family protein [Clostridium guangxiense]